ncbi:hypothetical protein ACFWOL_08105 [Streptomyces sp. NPDC058442]|uniref:hypothetical protein n=1 Tax=Streptomyces sp. NPDC058442 TaxID=3346503 RepID=UPI00366954DC
MGVVSFAAGLVFGLAEGRYAATPVFAVSATVFAAAWLYERRRRDSAAPAESRETAR